MIVLARTGRKIAALLLAILTLGGVALWAIVESGRLDAWVATEIAQRTGYQVQVAALKFRFPLTIAAELVEAGKTGRFHFKSSRLAVTFNPLDLGSKTLHRLELDRPVLQLDIDEILKAPGEGGADLALRHLALRDGTILLKKGGQTVFELPRINVQADHLNVGRTAGLSLRADIPQLDGEAELRVHGPLSDLNSEMSIRPKSSRGLLSRPGAQKLLSDILRVHVKLRAPRGQPAAAAVTGEFNQLTVAGNKFTGAIDVKVAFDAGFTEATFIGTTTLADFSNDAMPAPVKGAASGANAEFTALLAIPGKTLNVKTFRVTTPVGSGAGQGQMTFGDEANFVHAKFSLREVPLETFKSYLPAPLNQWSFNGYVQTAIELRGAWNDLDVTGVVETDAVQLRGGEVAAAQVALSAPFVWKKPSLRFKKSRLRATKVVYEPKDRWSGAIAELQLESSLEHQAGQPLKIEGLLDIAGAQFHSADNSKVGENIRIRGPFALSTPGADQATALVGRFTTESGELLWGKFFADLKHQSPALDLDAEYLPAENLLRCRRCALDLAHIGRLEATGAVEHLGAAPLLRLRAASGKFSPSGLFEFILRENFNRQYPILDKLAVGGELAFDLQLEGPLDTLSAEGELSLKSGELRAKSAQSNDWRIGPIALDLPLQIQLGANSAPARAAPRTGSLAIESMRFAGQTVEPIFVTLSLAHNELRVLRPISLGVFGGVLLIDRLFWPDLLNDTTRFSFSAEVKNLRLEEFTQALDWPRLGGTLTGSIPEVQTTGNLLTTRGEIDVDLFGGRMRMSSLAVENPFSSLPSIKLGARFDEIQLEQLTRSFAFGRIAGVVAGSIDNLILIAGQPSEFSAQLYSVDRGGEQRISVEALDKITVLSSGESASALYGGIAALFDSFRYSKLGFKATLKNDRLTLRGVENRGGQEMLVVGSLLPPTVNVVSHTQQIAFSELLRRLERINKTNRPNVK